MSSHNIFSLKNKNKFENLRRFTAAVLTDALRGVVTLSADTTVKYYFTSHLKRGLLKRGKNASLVQGNREANRNSLEVITLVKWYVYSVVQSDQGLHCLLVHQYILPFHSCRLTKYLFKHSRFR